MRTNTSGRGGFGTRTSVASRARIGGTTISGTSKSPGTTGYKGCCNCFTGKVQSFKTLITQTTGTTGRFNRPTPATLNTFANWINKGAIIQTVSKAQISRWAKSTNKNFNSRTCTPTSCKTILCAKFGKNAIKAVARTKTGSFMVVTPPQIKGRNFCFPK